MYVALLTARMHKAPQQITIRKSLDIKAAINNKRRWLQTTIPAPWGSAFSKKVSQEQEAQRRSNKGGSKADLRERVSVQKPPHCGERSSQFHGGRKKVPQSWDHCPEGTTTLGLQTGLGRHQETLTG